MYHNKQEIATKLYSILEDTQVTDEKGTIHIDKLLNPQQKYDLVIKLLNGLPNTDFKNILEYNELINIKREETPIFNDFKYKETVYKQILRNVLKLGFALGHSNISLYNTIIGEYITIEKDVPNISSSNTLKYIIRTINNCYSAIDVFNFTSIYSKVVEKINKSNLTKLLYISRQKDFIVKTVKHYNTKGKEVFTDDLKNGYVVIRDNDTNEILKPVTYLEPDIETIIYKHLKNLNK